MEAELELGIINSLIDEGNLSEANEILYKRLCSLPYDQKTRDLLRQIAQKSRQFNQDAFSSNLEKIILNKYRYSIRGAARGWQYTRILDQKYLDSRIKDYISHSNKKWMPKKKNQNPLTNFYEDYDHDILAKLQSIPNLIERWKYAEKLVIGDRLDQLSDSYNGLEGKELNKELTEFISGNELNVVILGAGCIGLALANSLKTGLGTKVNILIIENRVIRLHYKKPYTRNWLTNIPTKLFSGIFDPIITQLLSEFGQPNYIGGKLNLIETLLFLSCKSLNVKFLFSSTYDPTFIKNTKTHVIFDATGGKLETKRTDMDLAPANVSFELDPIGCLGKRHLNHGITNRDSADAVTILLKKEEGWYYPHIHNQQIANAMLKITSIPIKFYEDILRYTSSKNSDSIFYVWPGRLLPRLNEVLVMISLGLENYEELSQFIPQKITLPVFIKMGGLELTSTDTRVNGLFEFINKISDGCENIEIQHPFLNKPHLKIYRRQFSRFQDKLLIPVGDSLLTGNPKVGNGLGIHLQFVRSIHDAFLYLCNQR
jgi:hypothetical protein